MASETQTNDTLIIERVYRHPVAKVWQAISQGQVMCQWFMKTNFRAEPGFAYEAFGKAAGEWDGRIYGEVLEVDAPTTLVYTFQTNELASPLRVSWQLSKHADGTLLRLEQKGFGKLANAAAMFEDIAEGWKRCLDELQDLLGEAAN